MVVDDEPKIRRGLCKFIEKSGLPLEICAQANDGNAALQLFLKLKPHIVLLDINMPHMDGLKFLSEVKASGIKTKCIVITGFDDFSFAQASVSLRAFAYLLKPINDAELRENLQLAIDEIEQEQTQTAKSQQAISHIENNHTALWNIFAQKWMNGTLEPEQIQSELFFWGIKWPRPAFLTLIKANFKYGNILARHEQQLLLYGIANITEELLQPYDAVFCSQDEKDCCAAITAIIPTSEMLNDMCTVIERHLHVHCRIECAEVLSSNEVSHCMSLLKSHLEELENASPLLEEMKRYIDSNFHNSDLSLERLASALNVSQPYISRLIKTALQTNFVDYLTAKRMDEAMRLMAQQNLKLALIAKKVGYANQHYFSAVFKKHVGVSPSEYRTKNLG